jgi:glycosyltransferase involved in cell wall biosynthesis
VLRPLYLARHLQELEPGWQVEILTGPGASSDRWSPSDAALSYLGADLVVRRVEEPEPAGGNGRVRELAERWLRVPGPWSAWWAQNVERFGDGPAGGVDVIVATMPPYQTAPGAATIARHHRKPWIADLRDPWALDEMTIHATGLHRRLEARSMRTHLSSAAAIVTTTSEAARQIRDSFPDLADRPVVSIPNGFSAADFADPAPSRKDGVFRIVHTGSLHTDLGNRQRAITGARRLVGGGAGAADVLTRSHVFLVSAIEQLLARDPSLAPVIELHLAGVLSPADGAEARRLPQVRLHGHVGHDAAVELLLSADLLFLPMQKMPPGVRATIVPGKLYEYLGAERPILAAVPEGDARDILAEAGSARICEPDDVAGMAAAIEAELRRWRSGGPAPRVSVSVLERFERRALAARYSELLNAVVEERALPTGSS